MGKALRWLLVLVVIGAGLAWWLRERGPAVDPGTWLTLEIAGEYVEQPMNPVLQRLFGRTERSLLPLLSTLRMAARDDRIEGLLVELKPLEVGWGKAAEIRGALARLTESGRRTIAYVEVESLGANAEYWVATAASEIVLAPATRSAVIGLAGEYLFLGGLFEKIGVEIEYERIGRYKSAVESFAESEMSDPNREMTASLLDSIDGRFVGAIAAARGLDAAAVRAAIDEAPTAPGRLVELGLADRVAHRDEIVSDLGDPPTLAGGDYAGTDPTTIGIEPRATYALVHGVGPVVTGSTTVSRTGDPMLAADAVAKALEDASKSDEIDAILFRVDSPGGSPLASDIVWRAVERARGRGKPVVASFSDVAASGGYYVACGADRIVSQPTTFTGSIGVFVLRPVLRGLLDELGVGVETMTRGARADLLLASRPLSPGAREVLEDDVERIYDLFVSRVAEGRSMEWPAVDAVGRGRVWTGEQALEAGLVDALGGLRAAVAEANELVGVPRDADVMLMPYPAPQSLAAQLRDALGVAVRGAMAPRLPIPLPRALETLVATVELLPAGAPLLIPPGLAEIH